MSAVFAIGVGALVIGSAAALYILCETAYRAVEVTARGR